MKKKVLTMILTAIIAIMATSAFAEVMGKWLCVNDSCRGCVITDNTRKCGRCGSFMNSGRMEDAGQGWWAVPFTCSNRQCGHSCKYKTHQ